MVSTNSVPPDLGTFALLPRELRDRIYALALDLNIAPRRHYTSCWEDEQVTEPLLPSRMGILLASKRIHQEAKITFFQVNEFTFWVDHACFQQKENRSIMGDVGFTLQIGHDDVFRAQGEKSFFKKIPSDMVPYMQYVHLAIGGVRGLSERDVVGPTIRSLLGPERPTYIPLLKMVHDACNILKTCYQLHRLRLSIRSIERTPGSIEMVLEPIRRLRGIKKCQPVVWSMQDDQWVDWNLKGSYGRYLNQIMAYPEGAEVPKYIGDEREPDQSEDEIFDTIGARWMGGTTFAYPEDDSDDYGDNIEDDDDDFYDDGFDDDLDLDGGFGDDYGDDEDNYVDYDLD